MLIVSLAIEFPAVAAMLLTGTICADCCSDVTSDIWFDDGRDRRVTHCSNADLFYCHSRWKFMWTMRRN